MGRIGKEMEVREKQGVCSPWGLEYPQSVSRGQRSKSLASHPKMALNLDSYESLEALKWEIVQQCRSVRRFP